MGGDENSESFCKPSFVCLTCLAIYGVKDGLKASYSWQKLQVMVVILSCR